jgi:cytochrome c biogenesis protein CcdA
MSDLSIITIISAAAIDSINPCAIGVLVFMLTFLFSMKGSRGRIVAIGLTYITVVYLAYFGAGLGLIRILSEMTFLEYIYKGAAVVLLIAGVLDIKDGLTKNKKPLLAIPASASPKIKKYIQKATVPAAVVLGGLVALFELPCTGGVYIAILSILSREGLTSSGIWLLALYNFVFVLPLLIILLLVTFGLSSEKVQAWQKENKNLMRLALGIGMIVLAILMLSNTL